MRQYLLILDMDLLAVDEQLDLEPINYLMARQEQEQCEGVLLSLADSAPAKLPGLELVVGARGVGGSGRRGRQPTRGSSRATATAPASRRGTPSRAGRSEGASRC